MFLSSSYCLLLFLLAITTTVYSYKVPCNHTSIACECIPSAEVCEFQLDIDHLQTFTRYQYTSYGETHNSGGKTWYLEDGQWHSVISNGPCDEESVPINDPSCTEPFAVDGETYRFFFAVNNRIPGPTLIVTQDQLVQVHVMNNLEAESISLHWHGMHQRGSNWMDGVEHLTQCGIPPRASFTYIFQATQYGTHWYHSHSGAQRTDGLYGSLIVREKEDDLTKIKSKIRDLTQIEDFQDLPDQHTLSFLDWQKLYSADVFSQIHSGIRYYDLDKFPPNIPSTSFIRTYSPDGAEVGAVPYWSGLINGRGSYSADRINTRLSIFEVAPDTVYRFRLVGAQSMFAYRFSIEDHDMTVIATDGAFIEPIVVDYIIIHSGERYDFLLKTKTDFSSGKYNFAIHALTLEVTDPGERLALKGNHTAEAILHYTVEEGSSIPTSSEYNSILGNRQYGVDPEQLRCNSLDHCKTLNCPFKEYPSSYNTDCIHIHQLKLLFPITDTDQLPDINVPSENRLFFNFGFEGAYRVSSINGFNLHLPSSPLAVTDYSKIDDIKNKEFCPTVTPPSCDNNTNLVLSEACVCTHVRSIQPDRSIMAVFSAVGPKPTDTSKYIFAHPIHLHGHYFHVVDIQFGEYNDGQLVAGNDDIDCGGRHLCINPAWNRAIEREYDKKTGSVSSTAPLKDTVLIPAGGYAVVYFKSDNPGWWFLHCHIEPHQMDGMSVIIDEGGNNKIPAPNTMGTCGNFSFTPEQYQKAIKNEFNTSADSGSSMSDVAVAFIGVIVGLICGVLVTILIAGLIFRRWKKRAGYARV